MTKKQSIAEQYLHVKEQHKEELVFFQIGEFYEVLFDDAVKAAHLLNINLTKRGKYRDQDIPLCGVPIHTMELYVSKLIKQKQRVAVYEQGDTPTRVLKRVFTPGTILSDELLNGGKNNFLMCLIDAGKKIEVCIGDISTGEVYFKKTDVDDLDSLLLQWNPVEIILPEDFLTKKSTQDTFYTWLSQITPLEEDFFKVSDYIYQDFFDIELDIEVKSQALKGLLHYIQHTKAFNIKQLKHPQLLLDSEYMYVSKNSRINLELCQTTQGEKEGSLLLALNKTSTSSGSRWLNKQLNAPLINLLVINQRLDYVEFFLKNYTLSYNIASLLSNMPDIERATHRINSGVEKKQDFINTLKGLELLIKMEKMLEPHRSCTLIADFSNLVAKLYPLHDLFAKNVVESLGGFINHSANQILQDLTHEETVINKRITLLEEEYQLESDIKKLKIKYQQSLGYFIEVSSKDAGKISYNFKLLQNLTNAKRYITGTLEEINLKLTQIELDKKTAEDQIKLSLIENVRGSKLLLHKTYELLSQIDVFVAFAKTAKLYDFARPEFVDETCLKIEKGYHISLASNDVKFQPNDCELNKESGVMFLTGPNMSGKSTYMRQNAQLIVMAQIGSFVPAKYAKLNITDAIYTRIGAYDDITQGKSTFMCEMTELSQILRHATDKSFILLDEIGRGTNPKEGGAIAQAVLEHIMDKVKARTVFATHFSDIGFHLQAKYPTLQCKTMDFEIITQDSENINFLHKIKDGISTYSYGLAVAKQAGLSDDIIGKAKQIFDDNNS